MEGGGRREREGEGVMREEGGREKGGTRVTGKKGRRREGGGRGERGGRE